MAKILIVEDDALLSRMYEKIIAFEGYEVEIATDGEEGLEKARTIQPDLILLDVMLPKVNGFEVLERLKADSATRNLPVIMLSNLSEESSMQEALEKGAAKYILKSNTDPKQIAETIKEILLIKKNKN